jgi:hypothetical protein
MKKIINVYVGTDLSMTTPTHPLSCATATKRMIDKIVGMPDSKFDINTNSEASIRVFQLYGLHKGLTINFHINGKKSSYKAVLEDFKRADNYIRELQNQIENEK